MSGWARREVAIPIAAPPAGLAVDALINGPRQRSSSKHQVVWLEEHRLLLLRSTVPVRTTDPDPGLTAITKAVDYWNNQTRMVLGAFNLDDSARLVAWTWDADNTGS